MRERQQTSSGDNALEQHPLQGVIQGIRKNLRNRVAFQNDQGSAGVLKIPKENPGKPLIPADSPKPSDAADAAKTNETLEERWKREDEEIKDRLAPLPQ